MTWASVRDMPYEELLRERKRCLDEQLWTANRDTSTYYAKRYAEVCAELMERGPFLQNTGLPAVVDE